MNSWSRLHTSGSCRKGLKANGCRDDQSLMGGHNPQVTSKQPWHISTTDFSSSFSNGEMECCGGKTNFGVSQWVQLGNGAGWALETDCGAANWIDFHSGALRDMQSVSESSAVMLGDVSVRLTAAPIELRYRLVRIKKESKSTRSP